MPEAGETRVLVSLSSQVTRDWAQRGTCAFLLFRLQSGRQNPPLSLSCSEEEELGGGPGQRRAAGETATWTRTPNGHAGRREGHGHAPAHFRAVGSSCEAAQEGEVGTGAWDTRFSGLAQVYGQEEARSPEERGPDPVKKAETLLFGRS